MSQGAPSPQEWRALHSEVQAKAARATKRELEGDLDEAFDLYISSAQTYLFLVRNAPDPTTIAQLKAVASKLLDRAQRIKLARTSVRAKAPNRLAKEEQDVVLFRSASVNGNTYTSSSSAKAPEQSSSISRPRFSKRQLEAKAQWRSRTSIPGSPAVYRAGVAATDIVQDVVTDCSVVAALAAAVHHNAKFGTKVFMPCTFALNQGIDDAVPVGQDDRLLCARTRQGDAIWPALLEKAYLQVMGGYDFAGSNSSTDLHCLTGWIPETIEMKSTRFSIERTWDQLLHGFKAGQCLVTAGTGADRDGSLERAGLIPLHDYAVLDVDEDEDGRRSVQLYNAWNTTHPSRASSSLSDPDRWTSGLRHAIESTDDTASGTFRVSYSSLRTFFDTLYLNWDPASFEHSQTVHSSTLPAHAIGLRFGPAPLADCQREVWILLSRHFVNRDEDREQYLSLHALADDSAHAFADVASEAATTGVFSNAYHILTKLVPSRPQASYTLTVSHRSGSSAPSTRSNHGGIRFSLSVYSACPFALRDAGPATLPYVDEVSGEWTKRTSGGHHGLATFGDNPMWRLTIGGAKAVEVRVRLVAKRKEDDAVQGDAVDPGSDMTKPINVKIVRSTGDGRVFHLEERDVVADSGKYVRGSAHLRAGELRPGSYTIVASTFSAGSDGLGPFTITIESSEALAGIEAIPSEGAGMFRRIANARWGQDGLEIKGGKAASNVKVRVQAILPSPDTPTPPIRVSIFRRSSYGGDDELVASSGRFMDTRSGCATGLVRIAFSPDVRYLIKPEVYGQSLPDGCRVTLYTDQPLSLEQAM